MKLTIYGELYSSKNSRQGIVVKGRIIPIKSKKSKAQEADLHYQLSALRKQFQQMIDGKEYPLRMKIKLYRRTHGIFDYCNITQGMFDAMVRAGLLPDDDARHLIPVYEQYEKDPERPRTEIEIL